MSDDKKACAPQVGSPPSIKHEPDSQPPQDVLASSPLVKLIVAELAQDDPESLMRLVAYSSSPSPLIEDHPEPLSIGEATESEDLQSLRNQLELSKYEYAALEERYRTLQTQHAGSQKMSQALTEVIHGTFSYEDEAVSIEQLRADAGHEGLRAKALKLNTIRPIIRGAGGLQLMMNQAQSVSSLIEDAGSLEHLQALVAEGNMLRFRLSDIGGLSGLDHLISQFNALQSSHQELVELKVQLDGPDGLRAKAEKYSKLQLAFSVIETRATSVTTPNYQSDACKGMLGANASASAVDRIRSGPDGIAAMNPARARMLSSKAPSKDPDRDLYDPKPAIIKASNSKKGSNHIPLGPFRGGKCSQEASRQASEKRQHDDTGSEVKAAKRPRVDIGRASALVHATLVSSNAKATPSTSDARRPTTPLSRYPLNYGEDRIEVSQLEGPGFARVQQQVTPAGPHNANEPVRVARLNVDSLLEPSQHCGQSTVKQEGRGDACYTELMLDNTSAVSLAERDRVAVLVGGYPIALWTGPPLPDSHDPGDLIKPKDVPADLGEFLAGEMEKYLTATRLETLKTMPANPNTCVLRYLIDGHRPSGQPQAHRACRACSSAWVSNPRPCVLLQVVDGVGMLVFLPLRDQLKRGVAWTEKRFWVMEP